MTVVGIECNGATFLRHSKMVHTRNCFKDFFQNSASKLANCTIVNKIVNYLMLELANS